MKKPVISKRHKILLSDSPELLGAIRESILQTAKVLPLIASTPNQTRALAQIWKPDLIILSGEDMASVCKNLKSSAQTRSIPVIALILNNEMNRRRKVLEAGCDDWLATPIREMDLLTKIQNLTGFLFRKIPRYSFRAPASVFFKNKEFPSQSIDINRRMIFLESQEGLTPAVGQNLELNFQITDNEKVKCWGRMEQLLTRRGFQDEADTLGMLIRFLDLPEKAAKRIDALAIGQSQKKPSQQVRTTGTNLPWLEDKEYLEISKALVSKNSSDSIGKLVVPETTLQDFVEGLSQIEINAFGNDGDHFLQQTGTVSSQHPRNA
jgi:CheY-like chemotaxis protein